MVAGAAAQSLGIGSDPADLARAALGADPGSASVAVWRAGGLRAATAHNEAPLGGLPIAPAAADAPPPLYEIGSISKVFTGLLLAQAVERGELALGDTLGALLQGKLVFAAPAVAAITLEQLVTHRSCLPRQFGGVRSGPAVVEQIRLADRAALWAALAAQQLARPAPCDAQYSNYGMAVLAEVLAERSGKPWSELVRDQITAPLALDDTRQHLGDKGPRLVPAFDGRRPAQAWDMQAFAGAGGLRSSAQELARFGRALVQGRQGPFGAAAERLVTPLAPYRGGQIGYAVFIDGPPARRTWSHDGLTGGYRALLTMYPDTGEVMAALVANRQAPLAQLGAGLAATRYPVTDLAVAIEPAALAAYPGVYRVDAELALVCVVHDGALYVRSTGSVFRAYIPVAPDVFTRPAGGAQLVFERRDGAVVGATLQQSGRILPAIRTPEAPPQEAVLAAPVARAYAGRYSAVRLMRAPIEFDVRERDGQLVVRSSAFAAQPVFPMAGRADRFHYEGGRAELQFERDASGKPVALVLHENGALRAVRSLPAP
jgi:CubicO group peptidase (beta-lactamase class C family)